MKEDKRFGRKRRRSASLGGGWGLWMCLGALGFIRRIVRFS